MKLTMSEGEPIIISETEMQMILKSGSQLVVLRNGNIINKAHIVSAIKTNDEIKDIRETTKNNLALPPISDEKIKERKKIREERLAEFNQKRKLK